MFDVADHLDELRCRETSWLLSQRAEALIREKRRLQVDELAIDTGARRTGWDRPDARGP